MVSKCCVDCGKGITSPRATRCRSCAQLMRWGGRQAREVSKCCVDCGKGIKGRRTVRCLSCGVKHRFRDRPRMEVRVSDHHREEVMKTRWATNARGYFQGCPFGGGRKGKIWSLHRYVWFLEYGKVPKMLDHIDGDKTNNEITNLRPASYALNNRNATRPGKKGLPPGVEAFNRPLKKPYRAAICRHGKQRSLGLFATAEEAGEAYRNAKEICIEFDALLALDE